MGTTGLYLLRRSGWWISLLFRLVGHLFSANFYLRIYWKIPNTNMHIVYNMPVIVSWSNILITRIKKKLESALTNIRSDSKEKGRTSNDYYFLHKIRTERAKSKMRKLGKGGHGNPEQFYQSTMYLISKLLFFVAVIASLSWSIDIISWNFTMICRKAKMCTYVAKFERAMTLYRV